MALLWVSGGWSFKDHSILPLLLRVLQSEWRMKSLRPLKMAGTTHTTIRRHITEDQNLQQHRCQDITYLKYRYFRSHYFNPIACMWCYLLFTLSSVYISSLISAICATEPSTQHSTFSYSETSFSFEYPTHPQPFTVTHSICYLHLCLRSVAILRSIPDR
jgi:hypothetical protein